MTDFAHRWGFSADRFWLHGAPPKAPVEFDEALGRWNVYGYPEIVEVLNDPEAYTPNCTRLFDLSAEAAQYVEGDMSQMTGPEHTHIRGQVGRAFTPKALDGLEGRIRELARELVDDLAGLDRFDLLGDFVEDVSAIAFSELLGTPVEEREVLRVKDQAMDYEGEMSTLDSGEDYFDGLTAPLAPLREFVGKYVDERVREPRDDLLSLLAGFRKLDGTALTRDQIINFAISILGAGRLATPMLSGNALLCLESFPDQAALVRADRSLVPGMLEESMRFVTPANVSFRATNVDVRLGGHRIAKDQLVMLWFGAANRDPRQFTDPDEFDVLRNPNPHLGFGRGAYYCVGAQLVRIETRIMFNLLMDYFPDLRVDPDRSPVFFRSPEFTGVRSMSVRPAGPNAAGRSYVRPAA
ncbi:MAG TPA: cytochrome P450 [Actinophytocola sp.]|uniref:cytochrome P450 n=1 Tax=Actinophytocola sp. TaxID=1872138 RepID=UPI002DBD9EE2|nr:cytochrome P450 [Actinophytocola sp.]HEU5471978.1 cytochrome P450 [Actinophytocola sp.]